MLKTPHNYVRYILWKWLPEDVEECFWIDADVYVNKDIVAMSDAIQFS